MSMKLIVKIPQHKSLGVFAVEISMTGNDRHHTIYFENLAQARQLIAALENGISYFGSTELMEEV